MSNSAQDTLKSIEVDVSHLIDGDMVYSISLLRSILEDMEDRFGPNASIRFDAGYNNVTVKVKTQGD